MTGQLGPRQRLALHSSVDVGADAGREARKRLADADQFLAAGQSDEAIETLSQVIERHGSAPIEIAPGRFISVRDYCHLTISRLAQSDPDTLRLYRERVDAVARNWYDHARRDRDLHRMRDVVDQFFCSSVGDEALFALGEMALSRGDYFAARRAWEQISPLLKSHEGKSLWLELRGRDVEADWEQVEPIATRRDQPLEWLAYPDTDLDLADVRARLVLVSILEGSLARAADELAVFTKLHPQSRGQWGGRETLLVEKLTALLAAAEQWPQPEPPADWPTFAGSFDRARQALPAGRLAGPAWAAAVDLGSPIPPDRKRVAEPHDGLLCYFPAVVGDLLIVPGDSRLRAFDAATGKPAWKQAGDEELPAEKRGTFFVDEESGLARRSFPRAAGAPRFTVTVHQERLFAVVGAGAMARAMNGFSDRRSNYLACFDLASKGLLLWTAAPVNRGEADAGDWAFEGPPVLSGDDAYIAVSKHNSDRKFSYVACLDAQTGRERWRRKICDGSRAWLGGGSHDLLTLASDTLFFNTNLGAVAALRASDGRLQWLHVYHQPDKDGLPELRTGAPAAFRDRDLTPALYHRGIVVAAPRDSGFIFGLDAATGCKLWDSSFADDAVHLLGAVDDMLIASGRTLWWLNIFGGRVERHWPEGEKTDPVGHGRGALAGDRVYWPVRSHSDTVDEIRVFDARTARQLEEPFRLNVFGARAGNLVMADGRLIIAATDRLYAFSGTPKKPDPPEPKLTQRTPPDEATSE